jgi:hypothetical protein
MVSNGGEKGRYGEAGFSGSPQHGGREAGWEKRWTRRHRYGRRAAESWASMPGPAGRTREFVEALCCFAVSYHRVGGGGISNTWICNAVELRFRGRPLAVVRRRN